MEEDELDKAIRLADEAEKLIQSLDRAFYDDGEFEKANECEQASNAIRSAIKRLESVKQH
jgi:hypothetical protein